MEGKTMNSREKFQKEKKRKEEIIRCAKEGWCPGDITETEAVLFQEELKRNEKCEYCLKESKKECECCEKKNKIWKADITNLPEE
jgi:hypothetical protein